MLRCEVWGVETNSETNSLRQMPTIGGIAAWHVPIVATTLAVGALGLGLLEIAVAVGLLGFVAQALLRSVVIELSPRGLTRGLLIRGRFLGRTTVMAWGTVTSVHTDWRRPGDDVALATIVLDDDGRTIYFTTAMGLHQYWACLAAVTARVPDARRSGLTDALLAGPPPGCTTFLSAARTAGMLAIVLAMLVGVHYLWALGQSTLTRSLGPTGDLGPPPTSHPSWSDR
jgi:hypothetical protein